MAKVTASAYEPALISDDPAVLSFEEGDVVEPEGEELESLLDALDESDAQFKRGESVPFEVVLSDMRRILYSA